MNMSMDESFDSHAWMSLTSAGSWESERERKEKQSNKNGEGNRKKEKRRRGKRTLCVYIHQSGG